MQFVLACRKCGGNNLRESRIRNFGELILSVIETPYRCRLCDHREFVVKMTVQRASEEEAGAEAVVVELGVPESTAELTSIAAPRPRIEIELERKQQQIERAGMESTHEPAAETAKSG
jgi:predicted nucleic-acid-binding Zn-ribbon protein